ncbi:MAG: hypothetical protein ABL859_06130 [Methylotenera sp.]
MSNFSATLIFMFAALCSCSNEQKISSRVKTEANFIGGDHGLEVTSRQSDCSGSTDKYDLRGKEFTPRELSVIGKLQAARNPNADRVIISRMSRTFDALIDQHRPGDKIYYFTIQLNDEHPLGGGYALSRNGCVIASFSTWIS